MSQRDAFNADLGIASGPEAAIRQRFAAAPALVEILLDKDVQSDFTTQENLAIAAKRRLQVAGGIAVCGAALALVLGALEVGGRSLGASGALWDTFIPMLGAVLGVGSVILAVALLYVKRLREAWLSARFCAERIRQWHFQTLLDGHLTDLAAADPPAFKAERAARYAMLCTGELAQPQGAMRQLLQSPGGSRLLSHPARPSQTGANKAELWEAFRWLRLEHQGIYWGVKMAPDRPGRALESVVATTTRVSFVLVLALLIVQLAIIAAVGFSHAREAGALHRLANWCGAVGMVLLALSSGARAVEDATCLRQEREHYTRMSLAYAGLAPKATLAGDAAAQLALMTELEIWAIDELRDFLKIHEASRYLS